MKEIRYLPMVIEQPKKIDYVVHKPYREVFNDAMEKIQAVIKAAIVSAYMCQVAARLVNLILIRTLPRKKKKKHKKMFAKINNSIEKTIEALEMLFLFTSIRYVRTLTLIKI